MLKSVYILLKKDYTQDEPQTFVLPAAFTSIEIANEYANDQREMYPSAIFVIEEVQIIDQ